MLLAFCLFYAFGQLSCEALRVLDREDCEPLVLIVRDYGLCRSHAINQNLRIKHL